MSGLSETSLLIQPLRASGASGGTIVIESPIPAPSSQRRTRQDARAVRQVAPERGEREAPRPTASHGRSTGSGRAEAAHSSGEAAASALVPSGTLRPPQSSAAFAAQLLGQDSGASAEGQATASSLERLRVSDAYRRSGGEPPLFPEAAAVFSLAV